MFAPDTPARESGGYPEPGAIQDVANHPDNSLPGPMQPAMKHSTEMAGDVIPIRDMSGQDAMSRDISTAGKQISNERSMSDIAARGASAVDKTNLTLFRRKWISS